jgi:putative intracellular protease/amidase
MVVTSQATLGDTGKPTGLWLEELAVPYMRFVDTGADVHGRVDPRRQGAGRPTVHTGHRTGGAAGGALPRGSERGAGLSHAVPIEALDATRFDAVFLPGGHGTMFDFR